MVYICNNNHHGVNHEDIQTDALLRCAMVKIIKTLSRARVLWILQSHIMFKVIERIVAAGQDTEAALDFCYWLFYILSILISKLSRDDPKFIVAPDKKVFKGRSHKNVFNG